jgi:phage terminase large subunit-like protein
LELVDARTRMVDTSQRNMLTFIKVLMFDQTAQGTVFRGVTVAEELNQGFLRLGDRHASGTSGKVWNTEFIRYVQLGKQYQRL